MSDHLLRLSVRCPECGAPPKLRKPTLAEVVLRGEPDAVVLTYECHVRKCGAIYEIRVHHFTEAA